MLYICVALLVSVLLFEASSGGVEAQGLTLSNVHVQWGRYLTPDGGDYTNFTVSSASLSNPNNAWLAVGLNNQNQMVRIAFSFFLLHTYIIIHSLIFQLITFIFLRAAPTYSCVKSRRRAAAR